MTTTRSSIVVTAPFSGTLVPLSEVPDETFASGVLGEGIAIEPSDGLFCSPVDGTVETIAETKHAIGFAADNGLEILVHVGLETVSLNGEGFEILVKEGDRVKAGQPVAKADLALIRERGLKTITSLVLTGGADDMELHCAEGLAAAGKTPVLTLTAKEAQPAEAAEAAPAAKEASAEKPKKKSFINFDFLQKLGKVLMTVIAVMPAAGLMISLGKLVQMGGGDIAAIMTIGTTMENIGWAVINNLHILFAVAIGGSWAKERAGGAFAAVLAFALINVITGNIFGVTSAMLEDPNAVTHTLFGQEIAVNGYFTSVLGAPALNMGVFVGIIAGFVGGVAYNNYTLFCNHVTIVAFRIFCRLGYSVVISIVLSLFWPVVQTGINNFGIWIANSSETSPVLAPFIYGTLERLLLPFGLHHMLTIPMNYTSFGGTYTIATGVNAGSQVFGQDPLWLAWANDLINFKKAGDMAAYNNLLATVTPARFKVGQMIGATGLLLGIALAMYRRVDADKRANYKSMFISTALAVFLTGVTEPLEFMFMFCAMPLYIVYALLQGCAFAMAGIIHLRLHSFGNLEFITRIPMSLQAGLGGDIINFVLCVAAFFVIGYFVAYFMIGKLKLATPGRLGNYTDDNADDTAAAKTEKKSDNGQAERIIALLGGRENIMLVDACMTRLRVTVKNPAKVADLAAWKAEGALSLLVKGDGIQAVYGPKADVLKSDINDIL